MDREYEAIVIGAGQAGPGVAAALAGGGKSTLLVEMDQVGGTCLNHGCKPTKALRASAVIAHQARRAAEFGVTTGPVSVDLATALRRVHTIIDTLRQDLADWVAGVDNLALRYGLARLETDPSGLHRVLIDDELLVTRAVYLDLGGRAAVPPIPGLDQVRYLTEVELLHLNALPEHLVIVGGGYIGCEFGQMFRRFGAEVTILAGDRVAPREDPDVSQLIADLLTTDGVRIVSGRAERVAPRGDGVAVTTGDGTTVTGSHLLIASGRRPNTDLLGERHGLRVDRRGTIEIDDRFATSVPGVWALGDVNGRGAFTHTAYQDSQILLDRSRSLQGRVTTYAMFTDPPLGRVGMSVAEAQASGRRVLKAEVPMSRVSRAVLEGETSGLMRILVDGDSEEILGATIVGMHADDLIQTLSFALQAGVRYSQIRDALPIHPTMAEYIPSALNSLSPL